VFTGKESRLGGNVGGGVMGFSGHWGFKADVRCFRATGSYDNTGTASVASGTTGTTGTSPTPPSGPGPIYAANAGSMSAASAPPPNTATTNIADLALSGLHYWRWNVGIAVRW
jgi:hypothetical protein